MSQTSNKPANPGVSQTPVPTWLGAGLIGLVLGIGSTLIVMRAYSMNRKESAEVVDNSTGIPMSSPPGTGSGGPPPMMGMMGMGGGGGGGGAGARTKRTLSSLVGKLELLTRETLHVDLETEQTTKIGNELAKLDQTDKMTAEEAQSHIDAIEALLTPDQKQALESISLPFGRPAGSGPGGAPGGPAGPGGPMGGPMMGGGGAEDENPFKQETNQKRLRDLLARIRPADATSEPANTEPAATESEKTEPPTEK